MEKEKNFFFKMSSLPEQSAIAYRNGYNLSNGFDLNSQFLQQLGYNPSDPASALSALEFFKSVGLLQPQMGETHPNPTESTVYSLHNLLKNIYI